MGRFVNPNAAAFQCAVNSEVYIDKTGLLEYILCGVGAVCCGNAKVQNIAETGRQAESGDKRNSDRAFSDSSIQYRKA